MTIELSPARTANKLSRILETVFAVHGGLRFPVNVTSLALETASIFRWNDPITEVKPVAIKGFQGALLPGDHKQKWMLLYNETLESPGRIRFTQAHELGHYVLHRTLRDEFQCSDAADMHNVAKDGKNLESQADLFTSYLLMPLDDFRKQLSTNIDFELLGHCADRYGVSLTAAALKWLDYTEEKAVLVVSTNGFIDWAWSSKPAAKAGAFFKTKRNVIPIPDGSLAANDTIRNERKGSTVSAKVWFQHAEAAMPLREMKVCADQYERVLTLLHLPSIADVWPQKNWGA